MNDSLSAHCGRCSNQFSRYKAAIRVTAHLAKRPAHYIWAVLIARIYGVLPLLCPICGGQMRLIAFITEGAQIRKILDYIGVDSEPPHIYPVRGTPLWGDGGDAQVDDEGQTEPDWDMAAQPAPNPNPSWQSQGHAIERLRALNLPGSNVFRSPQPVPYLASCA